MVAIVRPSMLGAIGRFEERYALVAPRQPSLTPASRSHRKVVSYHSRLWPKTNLDAHPATVVDSRASLVRRMRGFNHSGLASSCRGKRSIRRSAAVA
jgi:hypothetical protein